MASESLDPLDRRILAEAQRDAGLTMEALASLVCSTPATCHRRLKRLKGTGLISRSVSIADAARSDEPITAILGLALAEQNNSRQDQVKRFLKSRPEVRMAWMTTGDFDYLILTAFNDIQALGRFTEEVISRQPAIRHYRTFVSMEEVKFETWRAF